MLHLLDIFFVVFHTSLILFNLFGWAWKPLRKWNLLTLLLTGLSWTVLGIWYGFGYCPFTEWHFDILEKLGHRQLPASYIKYLLARFFDIDVPSQTVDILTGAGFIAALIISVYLNWRDYRVEKGSNIPE